MRMQSVIPIVVLALSSVTATARGTTAVPWDYQWRDIMGHCLDACDNSTYRCPCRIWYVPMPR